MLINFELFSKIKKICMSNLEEMKGYFEERNMEIVLQCIDILVMYICSIYDI